MSNEELLIFVRKNVVAVSCAVLIIVICVAMYYRKDLLPDAEKVLADKTKQGELLAANKEDANQLKEQYAQLVSENDAIASRMIHVGQLAENMQYFYKIESETGTKLSDPHQGSAAAPPKGQKPNFVSVGFTVSAKGDYGQLLNLLRKLENGDHYSRINTLRLTPTGEFRGGLMQMNVGMDLLAVQSE
ncbi:MAG TPA: hypothetical protein VGG34_00475 [Opitutaceae bacterium]|jgi:cell division protein FtsB|nr:hypothetical protein [Elusimicrobiota bacterium]